MQVLSYEATDEAGTERLGAALAELLPNGAVVALRGTLGAGKTRLVQSIAEHRGVDRRTVVSPTFVLVQEYQGRQPVYHIDAYRLRDEDEFLELGAEEYFEGDGVTLVEWADRVENCLPAERLEIHVDVTGDQSRHFEVRGVGEPFCGLVEHLAERLRTRS